VTSFAGLLAVTLADSGVVPLRLMPSVHQLQTAVHRLMKTYSRLVPNDTVGTLRWWLSVLFDLRRSCFELVGVSFLAQEFAKHYNVAGCRTCLVVKKFEKAAEMSWIRLSQQTRKVFTGRSVASWSTWRTFTDEYCVTLWRVLLTALSPNSCVTAVYCYYYYYHSSLSP